MLARSNSTGNIFLCLCPVLFKVGPSLGFDGSPSKHRVIHVLLIWSVSLTMREHVARLTRLILSVGDL